jgi:hypothetical protein
MVNRKLIAAVCGAVMLVLGMAMSVNAGETARETTYLTFSARFALPGISLPAGTYIFERPEFGRPAVVRVRSRDGSQLFLSAFTRVIERPRELPPDSQVAFGEAPRGTAPRVSVWYPIGESMGHQFIYETNSRQLTGQTDN